MLYYNLLQACLFPCRVHNHHTSPLLNTQPHFDCPSCSTASVPVVPVVPLFQCSSCSTIAVVPVFWLFRLFQLFQFFQLFLLFQLFQLFQLLCCSSCSSVPVFRLLQLGDIYVCTLYMFMPHTNICIPCTCMHTHRSHPCTHPPETG